MINNVVGSSPGSWPGRFGRAMESFGNYAGAGAAEMMGAHSVGTTIGGAPIMQLGNYPFEAGRMPRPAPRGFIAQPLTGLQKFATGASIAGSAYNIYAGYQEEGLKGAAESALWDLSIMSAVHRFGYIKSGGAFIADRQIRRSFGAVAGSLVGSAMMGGGLTSVPGMFAGAAAGAAPVRTAKMAGRFAMRHPLLALGAAGGTALAGGAAALSYGAYHTLKAGHSYRQQQKQIHTSGSLAAFHTQGAMTMRSRAVSAIHKSHLNARSALGQEANFMHMPSKNYHSAYRR